MPKDPARSREVGVESGSRTRARARAGAGHVCPGERAVSLARLARWGRYGPLWATMDRYGPQWAAMGRGAQLLAAVDRSGPLWAALGRSGQLSAALGRWGHCGPLGSFGVSRALVAAPGRRVR